MAVIISVRCLHVLLGDVEVWVVKFRLGGEDGDALGDAAQAQEGLGVRARRAGLVDEGKDIPVASKAAEGRSFDRRHRTQGRNLVSAVNVLGALHCAWSGSACARHRWVGQEVGCGLASRHAPATGDVPKSDVLRQVTFAMLPVAPKYFDPTSAAINPSVCDYVPARTGGGAVQSQALAFKLT